MTSSRTQCLEPGADGFPRRLVGLRPAIRELHVAGTIRDLAPAVAIVGSRAASSAAMTIARELGARVAQRGGVVISGGAIGVDTAAHLGALEGAGPTTVVLGTGVDIIYPERNARLYAAVVERGGALVSMFPMGTPPRRDTFVRRNLVIAALSDVTVVVAAANTSGSLHTARDAIKLGRAIAAVPGTPGTDALVTAGAAIVENAADLDRMLDGDPRTLERPALAGDAARAWDALDVRSPRDAGDVAQALGVSIPRALALLNDLQAAGWILAVPGSAYVRAS
ncbi:MAG TPA: DNA-processing protein DprA [Kofleriaceae bacterium]|nr:DNA-processing protein DprA [Kofleriaceae bacterium]